MDASKSPSRRWLIVLNRFGVKECLPESPQALRVSDEFCTQFARLVGPASLNGGILPNTNTVEEDMTYLPNVAYTRARMVLAMEQSEQECETPSSQTSTSHMIQQNSLYQIKEYRENPHTRQANKIYRGARNMIDWRTPLDFVRAVGNNQHPSDVLLGAALRDIGELMKRIKSLENTIGMMQKVNDSLRLPDKADVEENPVTKSEADDTEADWDIVERDNKQ